MESRTSPPIHHFRLDLDGYQLLDGNSPVRLEKQPMELLILLAKRGGHLVTRDEMATALWGDGVFVDTDRSINNIVRKLRQALQDDPDYPQFVETVVGKGYRFIGPLEITPTQEDSSSGVGPPPVALGAARSKLPWKLLLAAAVVTAVATFAWLSMPRYQTLRKELAPISSVAVLPLENLSADPQQEYFAEGMTDELITDLAQMSGLRVTSRSSVMHYKHAQKTLPEIASELSVDAVVEGTLARVGDRVRIRVQLIRAADDRHLWAQAYDREYRDVLLLQSEAAHDIAQAINLKLDPSNLLDRSRARPVSPEAYDAYLKGRYFWNERSTVGHEKAVAYFEEAVQLAPDSAMGYSGLADAYLDGAWMAGEDPTVAAAKARAAVTKALELDPNLAEAHVSLAGILEVYDWNWGEADKEYQRGLELNPNSAVGHHIYAIFLACMGRFDQATAHMRTAEQLDPLTPAVYTHGGLISFMARQDDVAIEQYQKALEIDPNFALAHANLSAIYWYEGKYAESLEEKQRAAVLDHEPPEIQQAVRQAFRRGGDEAATRKLLELDSNGRYPGYRKMRNIQRAWLYSRLGEKPEALACLEKAFQEREPLMELTSVDRAWDYVRSEPRFQSLVRQMGLPTNLAH